MLEAAALEVDGRGRVPHLWVLSWASCAADSSFLRCLQPGFWGLSSAQASLRTALALWESSARLSSKRGAADSEVGVAEVTLSWLRLALPVLAEGPWASCLHSPSLRSVSRK